MILHNFLLTVIIFCDIIILKAVKYVIGKTLQQILNEKGLNTNELAKMIGVSNQTLYSIIKRDNMKIDFEVLAKICSALDVDIERFYSDYINSPRIKMSLTAHQKKVIAAYIDHPEMQAAVDKLLGVYEEEPRYVWRAARSENHTPPQIVEMSAEELDILENAPGVTSDDDL